MLKLENINITFNKNTANERKALQHIDLDVGAVMVAAGLLATIGHILHRTGNRRYLEYLDSAQRHGRRSADSGTYKEAKTG